MIKFPYIIVPTEGSKLTTLDGNIEFQGQIVEIEMEVEELETILENYKKEKSIREST
jgi:hypothetical protein